MNYEKEYQKSIANPSQFWLEQAQKIKWLKPPQKGIEQSDDGMYHWFADGKINMSYLCIDQHIEDGYGDEVALIYDSAVRQNMIKYTYNDLKIEVEKLAGGLKSLGLKKGDTSVIYMPMIPHAIFSMLACARLGITHSVVFGGFAPKELALRIDDIKPKVLLTATSGIEVDRIIPYKPMVDEAIKMAKHKPDNVIIHNRKLGAENPQQSYDIDYDTFVEKSEPETFLPLNSDHPLYVLYTSGTTGSPKGIMRDTGGYAVALKYSMTNVYDAKPDETFWAASDIGWAVGHSFT
ncbi:MAG: AMP-binding protein, partial [Psychroflexus halocasei]